MAGAKIPGLARNWLLPVVLAAALIVIAGLSVLRPGVYLIPAFTGYLSFLLVGYVEAQIRAGRRPGGVAPPICPGDDWVKSLQRVEVLLARGAEGSSTPHQVTIH